MLAVTLRGVRPAIVAAAVLATARALGEAVMIQMVSGGRSFEPNPAAGVVFFYEPLRTLASAIVDYHEGVGAPALRRDAVCVCRAAAVRGVRAVDRRLSGQAAAAQVPDTRMSTSRPITQAAAEQPTSRRGRQSSPWTWRWGDRLVLVCAWTAGLGLCLVSAGIVIYMGYRGIQYLRPGLLFTRPAVSTIAEPDGRIPGSADRDRAADA